MNFGQCPLTRSPLRPNVFRLLVRQASSRENRARKNGGTLIDQRHRRDEHLGLCSNQGGLRCVLACQVCGPMFFQLEASFQQLRQVAFLCCLILHHCVQTIWNTLDFHSAHSKSCRWSCARFLPHLLKFSPCALSRAHVLFLCLCFGICLSLVRVRLTLHVELTHKKHGISL